MMLLNDLSVMESVDSTHSIFGGLTPKVVGAVNAVVRAGVSGQVSATVSPHGSTGSASYGAAGGAAGAAAGVIDVNPSFTIIIGVGFSV